MKVIGGFTVDNLNIEYSNNMNSNYLAYCKKSKQWRIMFCS